MSLPARMVLASCRAIAFILLLLFIADPVFVSFATEERRAVVPIMIDISRSMSIADTEEGARIDAAAEDAALIAEQLEDADIEFIPFAGSAAVAPSPIDSIGVADGEGTDIYGALGTVVGKYQSENFSSVILLTDGRVTRGMTSSGKDLPVKVFSIGYGDSTEGVDLRIDGILYERTLFTGNKARIEAMIAAHGVESGRIAAGLYEGDRLLSEVVKNAEGRGGRIRTVFEFKPEREGVYDLSVRVDPVKTEKILQNNTEQFRITVLKDRLRILYIDRYADWNMTFLGNLVKRSERLEMDIVTWNPAAGYHLLPGGTRWSVTNGGQELLAYDIVIIGDDDSLFTGTAGARSLVRFVQMGGGVLFIAGEVSPLLRRGPVELLEPILPVRAPGDPVLLTGEFNVRTNPGAGAGGLSEVIDTGGNLSRMPPLLAALAGMEASASASVPVIMEKNGEVFPMLVARRFGDGASAVLLGSPLWRWKLAGEAGEEAYAALFTGLIEYLAEGIDTPALELQADRTVYRAGERSEINAYIRPGTGIDGIRGEVIPVSGESESTVRTFVFDPVRGTAGEFRARLAPLPPGEYRIRADAESASGETIRSETSITVDPVSVEFISTSRDNGFLRRLSTFSGGRMLERSGISSIRELVDTEADTVDKRETRSARESLLFFISIISVLGIEWILRKSWGMV